MIQKIHYFWNYFKIDMKRCFVSRKILMGISGSFIILLLSLLEEWQNNQSVLYAFSMVQYGLPCLIAMIFCLYPYGACFCEDLQNNYYLQCIKRGSMVPYVFSKVLVIILSAIIVYVGSNLLFIGSLRMFLPWDTNDFQFLKSIAEINLFKGLLQDFNFGGYFFCYSLLKSLMVSLLALLASLMSLFITNRFLILTTPIIATYIYSYFIQTYIGYRFDILLLYDATYNLIGTETESLIWAVRYWGIGGAALTILIILGMKRRLVHG